jgi:hypothetical protein
MTRVHDPLDLGKEGTDNTFESQGGNASSGNTCYGSLRGDRRRYVCWFLIPGPGHSALQDHGEGRGSIRCLLVRLLATIVQTLRLPALRTKAVHAYLFTASRGWLPLRSGARGTYY